MVTSKIPVLVKAVLERAGVHGNARADALVSGQVVRTHVERLREDSQVAKVRLSAAGLVVGERRLRDAGLGREVELREAARLTGCPES